MFGLFKKKDPQRQASGNENVVDKTAALLNMQLMLCRSQSDFLQRLEWDVIRGYLIGYFDCSLQRLGHPIDSDEEFFMLMIRGHSFLLEKYVRDPQAYTFASLRLQGTPQFTEGQEAGGNDCNDQLNGKFTRMPMTLSNYFMKN